MESAAVMYTEEDYFKLPENVRAELINGFLIYAQAAPSTIHQSILSELHAEIHSYIKAKGGSCKIFPAPFAVKLQEDRNTIVEPDISVICDKGKITKRGCIGAPDWIIEIVSPGNQKHDYVTKLGLYESAGVREYWIVDPARECVWVYFFEKNHFKVNSYTFQDTIPVNIYDDFLIDFKQLSFFL